MLGKELSVTFILSSSGFSWSSCVKCNDNVRAECGDLSFAESRAGGGGCQGSVVMSCADTQSGVMSPVGYASVMSLVIG